MSVFSFFEQYILSQWPNVSNKKNITVLYVIYGHNNYGHEKFWKGKDAERKESERKIETEERERCMKKLSKKWEGRKGGMEGGRERGKRIDGEVGLRNLSFFMAAWGQWNPKSEEE